MAETTLLFLSPIYKKILNKKLGSKKGIAYFRLIFK